VDHETGRNLHDKKVGIGGFEDRAAALRVIAEARERAAGG